MKTMQFVGKDLAHVLKMLVLPSSHEIVFHKKLKLGLKVLNEFIWKGVIVNLG
jgi:hypothetical protein